MLRWAGVFGRDICHGPVHVGWTGYLLYYLPYCKARGWIPRPSGCALQFKNPPAM